MCAQACGAWRRVRTSASADVFVGLSAPDILTVEDIVEELFGEIEDEHDSMALTEKNLGEGRYLFSARLEVDYINENYKLQLPEHENYETLGGLVVHNTETIPLQNECIVVQDFKFKIEEVSNTKIEMISIEVKATD